MKPLTVHASPRSSVFASIAGLFGIGIGVIVLIVHLSLQKSLGVPYIVFFEPTILRPRMLKMNRRDRHLKPKDTKNQR